MRSQFETGENEDTPDLSGVVAAIAILEDEVTDDRIGALVEGVREIRDRSGNRARHDRPFAASLWC